MIAAADELAALGVDAACRLPACTPMPTRSTSSGSARWWRSATTDIHISLSSVVLPEYREYERAMTTLIDVMVKPYCKTYLGHAERSIRRALRARCPS